MTYRVATITLNPAYDLLGFCPKVELGDVNLVQTNALLAAGKGINVAKVLSDLDVQLTIGGFLGKENRDGFNLLFKSLNVIDKFETIEGRTRINVKLTEENSEVTDLNFSGFTINDQDWQHFVTNSLEWLKDIDMVAISGSLPVGVSLDKFTKWMEQVKAICPKIVFDSSRDALVAGLKAKPWLIKPNDKELEMWVGRKLPTLEDVKAAAMKLVNDGIENVVISLGSKGALWVTKNEAWLAKPPKCHVVSTVGAGDSMVAGLMYGLMTNRSIKDTLVFASSVAALSVGQAGVGISDCQAVNNMLEKIEIISE
ncbi:MULTISPECIES: 1-phosphofructokinase [unclassified Gilliamella]|uniref:1-phosphofructokinase n=1 Tax=unclassified Gilliamella TaxID=2685620 RepID=UPI0004619C9B|nr:1-phosphofructokinase [Gilliamella apicola]KDN10195.1 1-phosphofructokinase [Gilliamella apicola]OCG51662.1 1-phosphofructokinase [Gilliamella apicola]OCG60856.1 1-phosphofructokinase [Gilliamella apicola]